MFTPATVSDTEREICLNCQLPDCNEKSEECRLYHPKGVEMDISGLTKEQKTEIAREAKLRGVKTVAIEKGIDWTTVRAWIGSYCRKPKERKTDQTPVKVNQKIDHVEAMRLYGMDSLIDPVPRIEVTIVEKMLDQPSLDETRAFWAGVKAARGL